MKSITNRNDINKLVKLFYAKIRNNKTLVPIFNHHITENQWPEHIEKLTDFWETNILGIAKYKGNQSAKHKNVDPAIHYQIDQTYFSIWLQLWFETVNQLYQGKQAEKANNWLEKWQLINILLFGKTDLKHQTLN